MTAAARFLAIAAGGTGGHMFPAQALAETMLDRGWRVMLSTDARGARYAHGFPRDVVVQRVASASFAQGGAAAKPLVPFRVLAGIAAARRAFRRDPPDVVVGFGGYPSIPALAAAWTMGLPRMIHEQNGVLGRVNRILAPRVHCVACGTWPTPLPDGVTAEHTGNPVRGAVVERAGAPFIPPGDHPMQVLVIGGSQGARALSDIVPAAIAALPDRLRRHVRVAQQARDEDLDRVRAFYADKGIAAEVQTFFDDVAARLAEAQLVICRAGASTLADVTVVGRPAILIPYPHAAQDHQTANAAGLSQAGAAFVLQEPELDPPGLSSHIAAILDDPTKASAMAAAATRLGRPDAATRLAALVEKLAEGR